MGESTPVETINNEIEVERIHSPDDQEMEDVDEVISVVLEEVIAPDTPKEEVLNTDVEDFEMKQDANDANISKGDDVTLVEALAPEDNEESSEGAVGGEVDRSGASHLSDSKASSRLNVDLLGEQVMVILPNLSSVNKVIAPYYKLLGFQLKSYFSCLLEQLQQH